MKKIRRKSLSLLLILAMVFSLFVMPVGAVAEGAKVTVTVQDITGEVRTLATWTYSLADETFIDDATGNELAIVKDFSSAPLVYTGINRKPDPRCLAVATKAILLEDLYDYAIALAGGIDLRGAVEMNLTASSDGKGDQFSYDQYWGLTRYNYMNWYNASSYTTDASVFNDGVEVPSALAIKGYHGAGTGYTVDGLAAQADTLNALRVAVGQQLNGNKTIDTSGTYLSGNTAAGGTVTEDLNAGALSLNGISYIQFLLPTTFADAPTVTPTSAPEYNGYLETTATEIAPGETFTADLYIQSDDPLAAGSIDLQCTGGVISTVEPAVENASFAPDPTFGDTPDATGYVDFIGNTASAADGLKIATFTVTPNEDADTVMLAIEHGTAMASGTSEEIDLKLDDATMSVSVTVAQPTQAHSFQDGFCTDCGVYDPDAETYLVKTAANLQAIADAVNGGDSLAGKTVTLANDISLSDYADWVGIGNATTAFAGTFDGAGKTISDLTITTGTGGYRGLFGHSSGTVKDFTISGTIGTAEANITSGADGIGGAVGYNEGTVSGVIGNVTVYVNSGSIYAVGGVVGQNYANATVTQCANHGDVIASKHSGGVVGRNFGTVSECFNTGDITGNQGGKDGIGGVVGCCGDKNGTYANTVVNCYNTGTITNNGGRWHGGIAGFADKASTITNCYDVGQITPGYSWNWNPIIGHVDSAYPTVHDNYSLEGLNAGDTDASTQPLTIGTVKTEDEMKAKEFVTVLGEAFLFSCGETPVLSWQTPNDHTFENGVCTVCGEKDPNYTPPSPTTPPVTPSAPTSTKWDGKSVDVSWFIGKENRSSYNISTAAQLAGVAALVNGLVNEDCKVYTGTDVYTAAQWNSSPYVLGDTGTSGPNNQSTNAYHYGIENFNGKTLKITADLDMSKGNYMPIGGQYLMTDEDTSTKIDASFCGVLDGTGHNITIQCDRHCAGNYGDGQSVGLIGRLGVHDNEAGTIPVSGAAVRNLAVYGSVKGNRSVGGIVGKNGKTTDTSIIENCANFASVSGTDAKGTGGICGSAWNNIEIRNCYNAGSINNTHNSNGGIAGSCEGKVVNCFNVGEISGLSSNAAIATSNGGDSYENCYWLDSSADIGVYNKTLSSVMVKTSDEMKSPEVLAALGNAFVKDNATPINNGYPILTWQGKAPVNPPIGPGEDPEPTPSTDPEPTPSTDPTPQKPYYDDTVGHWAEEAIDRATELKLMNGVGNRLFAPDTIMDRAMLVTVLYRLEGSPAVTEANPFTDVANGTWYTDATIWANSNKIVNGYGGGLFGPTDPVTREQIATILYRYAEWKGYDVSKTKDLSAYTDASAISTWALKEMQWANAEGLITGRTATTLAPGGTANRAEVATILVRFCDSIGK